MVKPVLDGAGVWSRMVATFNYEVPNVNWTAEKLQYWSEHIEKFSHFRLTL